ncbi:MAG: ATP-binding cassette domain-containing protein [Rhodobacterales bacterium]|nr:ATP-binding cassette domain-containing protein [Rhodobacterales bacterium]
MPFINVQNASFSYPIYNAKSRSLKNAVFAGRAGGRRETGPGSTELVHALNNISLNLKSGDRLGLIGHNGAGKSTLLRLMAGIAHPTTGTVEFEGRVVPLISRGLGINPELTGRQNIELPLRLFGASTAEVQEAHKTVPEFTELGEFLDLPVRTYSDGMRARLSFAICTALRGDILILDEWLGAGDAGFVRKASNRLKTMVEQSGIVILASHTTSILQQNCNKLAWMRKGEIIAVGDPKDVSEAYAAEMRRYGQAGASGKPNEGEEAAKIRQAYIDDQVRLMDEAWFAKDYASARKIAEMLYAKENAARASYRLGTIYYYGRGAEKNLAQALPYFRHTSLTDDPWSIYHQGLILADRNYPGRDEDVARNLLEIAMMRGIRDAAQPLKAMEDRKLAVAS